MTFHIVSNLNQPSTCSICLDSLNLDQGVVAHSGGGERHPLHLACLQEFMQHQTNQQRFMQCPTCRLPIDHIPDIQFQQPVRRIIDLVNVHLDDAIYHRLMVSSVRGNVDEIISILRLSPNLEADRLLNCAQAAFEHNHRDASRYFLERMPQDSPIFRQLVRNYQPQNLRFIRYIVQQIGFNQSIKLMILQCFEDRNESLSISIFESIHPTNSIYQFFLKIAAQINMIELVKKICEKQDVPEEYLIEEITIASWTKKTDIFRVLARRSTRYRDFAGNYLQDGAQRGNLDIVRVIMEDLSRLPNKQDIIKAYQKAQGANKLEICQYLIRYLSPINEINRYSGFLF